MQVPEAARFFRILYDFRFILVQLDRELERLGRLRTIVTGLAFTSLTLEAAPLAPTSAATPTPALPMMAALPLPAAPAPRRAYRRRSPARPSLKPSPKQKTAQPTALTGKIPTGPVVVPAAMVQKLSAPVVPEPMTELHPDALLRQLSARWGTGLAISAP